MINYHYFRDIKFDRAGKYVISVTAYMEKPSAPLGINIMNGMIFRYLSNSQQVEEEAIKYIKTYCPEHLVHTILARRYDI